MMVHRKAIHRIACYGRVAMLHHLLKLNTRRTVDHNLLA